MTTKSKPKRKRHRFGDPNKDEVLAACGKVHGILMDLISAAATLTVDDDWIAAVEGMLEKVMSEAPMLLSTVESGEVVDAVTIVGCQRIMVELTARQLEVVSSALRRSAAALLEADKEPS